MILKKHPSPQEISHDFLFSNCQTMMLQAISLPDVRPTWHWGLFEKTACNHSFSSWAKHLWDSFFAIGPLLFSQSAAGGPCEFVAFCFCSVFRLKTCVYVKPAMFLGVAMGGESWVWSSSLFWGWMGKAQAGQGMKVFKLRKCSPKN